MSIPKNENQPLKTVDTSFRIVTALHEEGGSTVTGLANRLNLAKSTIHNHLTSLRQNGYVVKRNRQYHLGLKFLDHGTKAKTEIPLATAAQPVLKRLAAETKVAAWAIVEQHGYAIGLEREIGKEFDISAPRVGQRGHMHHQAGGKAILAHLPEERVREIIDMHGLPKATKHTITDEKELFDELEEIRETGIASDANEAIDGFGSISVPVIVRDTVHGALSIAGPTNRLYEAYNKDEIVDLLRGAQNEVSLNLQYPRRD